MRRFHYIVVPVHMLYYYGGEEILFVTPWTSFYRGSLYLCCIEAAIIALIFPRFYAAARPHPKF